MDTSNGTYNSFSAIVLIGAIFVIIFLIALGYSKLKKYLKKRSINMMLKHVISDSFNIISKVSTNYIENSSSRFFQVESSLSNLNAIKKTILAFKQKYSTSASLISGLSTLEKALRNTMTYSSNLIIYNELFDEILHYINNIENVYSQTKITHIIDDSKYQIFLKSLYEVKDILKNLKHLVENPNNYTNYKNNYIGIKDISRLFKANHYRCEEIIFNKREDEFDDALLSFSVEVLKCVITDLMYNYNVSSHEINQFIHFLDSNAYQDNGKNRIIYYFDNACSFFNIGLDESELNNFILWSYRFIENIKNINDDLNSSHKYELNNKITNFAFDLSPAGQGMFCTIPPENQEKFVYMSPDIQKQILKYSPVDQCRYFKEIKKYLNLPLQTVKIFINMDYKELLIDFPEFSDNQKQKYILERLNQI